MKLSVPAFNAFLGGIGQSVTWSAAFACPCRDPVSGASNYSCPVCSGTGEYWIAPVAAVMALSAQKIQRQWEQFGMYENGDVVVTLPSDTPAYAMGEFDRVVFSQSSEPFSFTFTHDGTDKLKGSIVSIQSVFWLLNGVTVTQGGIPTVGVGGVLTWPAGQIPPPTGAQYSITGRKNPEYFCYGNFPQDRAHQGGEALPRRVVLRRFDLFGRNTG